MSSSHIAFRSYFATFSRASPGLALNPSPWALVVPGAFDPQRRHCMHAQAVCYMHFQGNFLL